MSIHRNDSLIILSYVHEIMTSYHSNLLPYETDGKLFHVSKVLYENRYCNQDDFSILVCGGYTKNGTTLNDVYELRGPNFECSKFPSMLEARNYCKTAGINSDIVVVGGYNEAHTTLYSVELFHSNKKQWVCETELFDKRTEFCICFFKQNLYIIGGINENYQKLRSCRVFSLKYNKWSQIADMNEIRYRAACTVYEGKIVVTGGCSKSVESYDYNDNKWTYLPDMIDVRLNHALVSMGNKMFVIGGFLRRSTCEIFESCSRKFCYIRTRSEINNIASFKGACVSNQFIVFGEVMGKRQTKVFIFDVKANQWKNIDCSILNNKCFVSCIKYHH